MLKINQIEQVHQGRLRKRQYAGVPQTDRQTRRRQGHIQHLQGGKKIYPLYKLSDFDYYQ